MTSFTPIDPAVWPRREYFEHYYSEIPCTYSITNNLDITRVTEKKLQLYPVLLHALSVSVNSHEEFRIAFNADGKLGLYDIMHPCYTVFHKDTQTFSNIWTVYDRDFALFAQSYAADMEQFKDVHKMSAKPQTPPNTFPVSMLPWSGFTGFNLNLPKGSSYLTPIFTLGRYAHNGGRCLLPLSVQVHHAVCDGFHVCRLLNEVQQYLDSL